MFAHNSGFFFETESKKELGSSEVARQYANAEDEWLPQNPILHVVNHTCSVFAFLHVQLFAVF